MVIAVKVVHVIVCLSLVVVILLQQGKGADIGAVFGGSSQTLFGASGAGNILTKATGLLAVVFFSTSLFLAYSSTQHATGSIFEGRSGKSAIPSAPLPSVAPAGSTTPTAK